MSRRDLAQQRGADEKRAEKDYVAKIVENGLPPVDRKEVDATRMEYIHALERWEAAATSHDDTYGRTHEQREAALARFARDVERRKAIYEERAGRWNAQEDLERVAEQRRLVEEQTTAAKSQAKAADKQARYAYYSLVLAALLGAAVIVQTWTAYQAYRLQERTTVSAPK